MISDREICILAAERVLELKLLKSPDRSGLWWYDNLGIGLPYYHVDEWNPLDRVEQAMTLLTWRFHYSKGWRWQIADALEGYAVSIQHAANNVNARVVSASLARAICVAALTVKGVDFSEGGQS